MMYKLYLNKILLPVAPGRITVFSGGSAVSAVLAGGGFTTLKCGGDAPRKIVFDALLPAVKYPFAVYEDGQFKPPDYFESQFTALNGNPVLFVIARHGGAGVARLTALDRLDYTEDARNGRDVVARFSLTEYAHGGVTSVYGNAAFAETAAASAAKTVKYTVVTGDCLYNIAKKYLGNGGRYKEIYERNKAVIDPVNIKYDNPTYTIYTGQVLEIKTD